jgi:transposase
MSMEKCMMAAPVYPIKEVIMLSVLKSGLKTLVAWRLPPFMLRSALAILSSMPPPERDPSRTYERKPGAGRKRSPMENVLRAIFFILRTGMQWRALPRELFQVAGSTAHKYHMEWSKDGGFYMLWFADALVTYNEKRGIVWTKLAIDACNIAAPMALESVGPNPKDTGKNGSKRTVICDSRGVVLSIILSSANRHDVTQLVASLEAFGIEVPEEFYGLIHLFADKGYVGKEHEKTAREHGITLMTPNKGVGPSNRSRTIQRNRVIVERDHSWMNRFRKLKIRYEKTHRSYFGLMCISAVHIALRKAYGRDAFYADTTEAEEAA